MNKRDYLRSLGFTVGERGRFSADMHAAIESAPEGSIVEPAVVVKPARVTKPKVAKVTNLPTAAERNAPAAAPRPVLPVLRKQETLYALTPIGRTHAVVGYDNCFRCNQRVSVCPCTAGPKPPAGAIPVVGKPIA